jgi:hypothetical protein
LIAISQADAELTQTEVAGSARWGERVVIQLGRLPEQPQQYVGVQENVHGDSSLSQEASSVSGSGSSKS